MSLTLGIDLGTSSVKVCVWDTEARKVLAAAQYLDTENTIIAEQPGWAEQSPLQWWSDVRHAILRLNESKAYDPLDIAAIGIAYQMHGLVAIDQNGEPVRNSIIWCDSRAVPYGDKAFDHIGHEESLSKLLNSPGNFTAAKLAWVKEKEPEIFARINKIMLPGDYISLKMTGETDTTVSALSEGVFWDFRASSVSEDVMGFFGFDHSLIPAVNPLFSSHGHLPDTVAGELGLKAGIPVSYKAGDQPNNALSLNVMEPGEVAATAGTSGVIYGVAGQLTSDPESRVNSFAHVNHTDKDPRIGVLLCINGTGILNRWLRDTAGGGISYAGLNKEAKAVPAGSEELLVLPFGNGAERMLGNRLVGSHIAGIDLNKHGRGHLVRAGQEGIAFAFRYGLDIMRENGMAPALVRAGRANMFLSEVFTRAFVEATGLAVELHESDGSKGAAIGAAIGAGIYNRAGEAFRKDTVLATIEPEGKNDYEESYGRWKELLVKQLG